MSHSCWTGSSSFFLGPLQHTITGSEHQSITKTAQSLHQNTVSDENKPVENKGGSSQTEAEEQATMSEQ